ncbi:protein disulfide isomerase-like 1-6 [Rutidosis leptorrhynchoides]|uniref:protein disulfide isomerase-like 1-6 n=1 Tax=Rutidosis leptorrhynchoides TaxID=125765 RepID=UPI003A994485
MVFELWNHKQTTGEVGKNFKGLDNLVLAKIDASVNKHPKLEADDYLTIMFYPMSNKLNRIKLPTMWSSKELAIPINKYLKEQVHGEQHLEKDEL